MPEPADARKRRLFEQFRSRLEGLSAEEIQEMLDKRQIRSADRIALAKDMIKRQRAPGRAAAETTGVGPLARMAARAAGEGAEERPSGKGKTDGRQAAAEDERAPEAVPLARQVGRVLGIGLGIASIAALAIFVVRR